MMPFNFDAPDDRIEVKELFANLKMELPLLEELLSECELSRYEDYIYRFYHQSFKVYRLQGMTLKIVERLQALAPNRPLNNWFMQIIHEGTGKEFKDKDNKNWLVVTRPIIEAFFHAKYFLEMAVKYGKSLENPPRLMPSGWAAILYLYNLRYPFNPAIGKELSESHDLSTRIIGIKNKGIEIVNSLIDNKLKNVEYAVVDEGNGIINEYACHRIKTSKNICEKSYDALDDKELQRNVTPFMKDSDTVIVISDIDELDTHSISSLNFILSRIAIKSGADKFIGISMSNSDIHFYLVENADSAYYELFGEGTVLKESIFHINAINNSEDTVSLVINLVEMAKMNGHSSTTENSIIHICRKLEPELNLYSISTKYCLEDFGSLGDFT